MGHSHKGTKVPFKFSAVGQAPYLTAPQEDVLVWAYQGTLPDTWGLYNADFTNILDVLEQVPATDFGTSGIASPGDTIIVVGLSADGLHFQTARSNIAVYL